MVGVGVIGYGYWGPNLVRVFHECEGSQVVAVCDLDSSRLHVCTKRFPSIACSREVDELFDNPAIQLVALATPLPTHFELARRAIAAGKHVLVEKPLTRTAAEAEELIDLARRQGVLLAVDHTFIFTPAVAKIKELIDEGFLGRMNYVDSVRINLGLIQNELNVIWDLAPHDLSIVDFLLGRLPASIVATGTSHTASGQVDVAYLHLNFGGGLTANIHVNWLSPVKVRRMIFGGDQRMLMYDELSSNEKIRVFESRAVSVPSELRDSAAPLHRIDYRVGDIWTPHLPPREALAVEADHLVSAIQKGVSLLADGAAGLRVVEVLEACDRSLQSAGTAAQPATRKLTRHPGFGTTRPSEVVKVHATSPPEAIPLAKPVLGEPELARVRDVLLSGWVTQGPVTAAFESAVASYVGAEHAVAVSSATAALHLALCVLDVGDGDEVVVPSFTFVATANAIRYRGAKPVFVDVDPDSFNLDPRSVARVLTDRTKAILAVHQFGNPADLTDLRAIAQRHGCPLVEDAACALGSRWRGRPIGSDSALACFSFHPRKVVTTGEGGMIVTGNEEWAKRLRRLRHHGMDGTDWQRHQQLLPHRESYVEVGFNYRMSDLAAAVGLAQMERLDDLIEERIRLCENYDRGLSGHPSLEIRPLRPGTRSNGQTYAVCVRDDGPLNRDGLMRFLRRRGIAAKPGPACIHLEPCYRPLHPSLSLPHSEALDRRMLLLPLYPGLSDDDQRRVIDALWESAADKSASLPKAVLGAINMALEPTTLPGQCAPRFVTAAREQP